MFFCCPNELAIILINRCISLSLIFDLYHLIMSIYCVCVFFSLTCSIRRSARLLLCSTLSLDECFVWAWLLVPATVLVRSLCSAILLVLCSRDGEKYRYIYNCGFRLCFKRALFLILIFLSFLIDDLFFNIVLNYLIKLPY